MIEFIFKIHVRASNAQIIIVYLIEITKLRHIEKYAKLEKIEKIEKSFNLMKND